VKLKLSPSPLRYPGSKAALRLFVEQFLAHNNLLGTEFCEPFAGGASVSIFILENGLASRVRIVDIDHGVCAFWRQVFFNTKPFIARIKRLSITIRSWEKFQRASQIKPRTKAEELECAAGFLFLNRTSFSGIVGAGPIGGRDQSSEYALDCRFNREELIRRIEYLSQYRDRVTVEKADGISCIRSLKANDDCVLYVDPPYFEYGKKFYRHHFNEDDHAKLFSALKACKQPWLLSYDHSESIREKYDAFTTRSVSWMNVARKFNYRDELIITNVDMPNTLLDPAPYARKVS
jgi:DNA adenine methylase